MKNKKKKRELNIWLVLIISSVIVGGAAQGLNMLKDNFENNHRVEAESLIPWPDEPQSNQVSQLIFEGYLPETK